MSSNQIPKGVDCVNSDVLHDLNQQCYYLAHKHHYSYEKVKKSLELGEYEKPKPIKDHFISMLDPRYPGCLLDLEQPPVHLCFQGNIKILSLPRVAIIGSRVNSEYGAWITKQLVHRLHQNIVIVSGLAKGIDGIAHQEAIRSGKKTIGVIGSGLGVVYPKENMDLYRTMATNHLIVSEYQYDVGIKKHHFPARNRIIAGLCDVLIVIEAKIRSGSATTVMEALMLGKDIYCVPHRLSDELGAGNHLMIQEGANIIYDIDEFCAEINGRNNLTNHKIPLR